MATLNSAKQEDQYSISKVRIQSLVKEGLDQSIKDMKILLEKADAAKESTEQEIKKLQRELQEEKG